MDIIEITDPVEIGLFDRASDLQTRQKSHQVSMDEYIASRDREADMTVHFDGSQLVGTFVGDNKTSGKRLPYVSKYDDIFEQLYSESVQLHGTSSKHTPKHFEYIYTALKEDYEYTESPGAMPLDKYVAYKLRCKSAALYSLLRRFKYKSGFIKWTHFVTITYSDALFKSEAEFARSLRRQFNNLHDRKGWLVAGKFERGKKTGRLHFHALIYVPPGGMVGKFFVKRDYSIEDHRMQTAHINTYFMQRYGRNDFEDVSGYSKEAIQSKMQYILKYIRKDGGKMFYSRGMLTTKLLRLCPATDICCTVIYKHKRKIKAYVLFPDVIVRHDTDIERTNKRLF